uniref:Uncharacterized protein LOC114341674 n=1 Tax=Diabrotica virgifera virgifera TaxID=50390 RepID=A0A6P7GSL0_DIAVI
MHFKSTGIYPARGFSEELLLDKFKMQSLQRRRITQSLCFLFKIINNQVNTPELLQLLNLHVPRVASRTSQTFYVNRARSNILVQSPLVQMQAHYNANSDLFDIFNSNLRIIKNTANDIRLQPVTF